MLIVMNDPKHADKNIMWLDAGAYVYSLSVINDRISKAPQGVYIGRSSKYMRLASCRRTWFV